MYLLQKTSKMKILLMSRVCANVYNTKWENVLKIFPEELLVLTNIVKSSALETKLKILETKICLGDDPEYIQYKEELDKLFKKN